MFFAHIFWCTRVERRSRAVGAGANMREDDFEVALKVVVVGNGAVGKSSLIQRYCKGVFTAEYKKTIGVDFLERQLSLRGEDVRLMLWDTAGQEEFDAITKAYYRGAQGCVLAFSTTDRESFRAIESWRKKVEHECGSIPMVLVQNKIDLMDRATVSKEETEELARRMQLRLYRTSVKEDFNVNEVFRYLAERYLDQMNSPVDEYVRGPHSKGLHPITNNLRNGHLLKPLPGHRDTTTISLHRRLRPSRKSLRRSCSLL